MTPAATRRTSPSRQKLRQLQAAARRYGVPLWVLVGVKLMETGNDLNAANPFQFEPGTAASLRVDPESFGSSANGAARLLASYKRRFGSWNAAFEAYNGGPGAVGKGYAYNQTEVEAKLGEFGTSKAALGGGGRVLASSTMLSPLLELFGFKGGGGEAKPGEKHAPGTLGEAFGEGVVEGLGPLSFLGKLLEPAFWLRILEIIGGAVLVYLGLKSLTGIDLPTAIPVPV